MKKILIGILAAALLLTGCNAGSGESEITTTTTQVATTAAVKNPLQKTNENALNIAVPSGLKEHNPLLTTSSNMVNVLWLAYDSLFTINSEGIPEAELVESYRYEDGNYFVTLRKNVTFHSGKGLNADDVNYTINKVKEGGEDGAAKDTIYNHAKDIIEEVEVLGDLELRFKLRSGGISPLYALTFPILPNDGKLVGTGPYRITEEKDSDMTFEAYGDSWRTQPKIQTIKTIGYDSDDAISKAYKDNLVDVVFVDHGTIGLFKYAQNTNTLDTRTNTYYYLLPNLSSGKLSELKMRQALGYALDRESIVSRAFDNNAVMSDYPIPADSYVFDSELPSYFHDVGQFYRLFDELGYKQEKEGSKTKLEKDGENLKLKVLAIKTTDLYNQNIAYTLQSQLSDLGIEAEIELLDPEDYYKGISNRNYDLAIVSTSVTPEFNLSSMFGSGNRNLNGFQSSEMNDALSEIASGEDDIIKVKDGFTQVQTEIVKKLPQYGLCFTTNTLVYNDRLGGVSQIKNNNMLSGILNWSFEEGNNGDPVTTID